MPKQDPIDRKLVPAPRSMWRDIDRARRGSGMSRVEWVRDAIRIKLELARVSAEAQKA